MLCRRMIAKKDSFRFNRYKKVLCSLLPYTDENSAFPKAIRDDAIYRRVIELKAQLSLSNGNIGLGYKKLPILFLLKTRFDTISKFDYELLLLLSFLYYGAKFDLNSLLNFAPESPYWYHVVVSDYLLSNDKNKVYLTVFPINASYFTGRPSKLVFSSSRLLLFLKKVHKTMPISLSSIGRCRGLCFSCFGRLKGNFLTAGRIEFVAYHKNRNSKFSGKFPTPVTHKDVVGILTGKQHLLSCTKEKP